MDIDPESFGRFSEKLARFLGTGTFLFWQTLIVICWITLNLVAVSCRWDPYPFILLNLAFSTQAAYAAPLILLAQNRQDDRDRITLEEDRTAPRRPRPTPSTWPANWPRCESPSARSPPATTCAANSSGCARTWRSSPTARPWSGTRAPSGRTSARVAPRRRRSRRTWPTRVHLQIRPGSEARRTRKGPDRVWAGPFTWRWRELNPRPTLLCEGFSGRSPLCPYSAPPVSRTRWCDRPSRCLLSLEIPRPDPSVILLADARIRVGGTPGLTESLLAQAARANSAAI